MFGIVLITFLGVVLRTIFNNSPFWWDELYAVTMAGSPNFPFYSVFLDIGNPPLFYILSKIWLSITGNLGAGYEAVIRLLPSAFSICSIPLIYFLIKENEENKKLSLLCAFLFSINYYSIYTSSEYRCYSLLIFLIIILTIFLFRIYKNEQNKNFIIYSIIGALLANCHIYGVFVLICNFILMMFLLKNKLKFFYSNLFIFFTFLPWFLISFFLSKGSLGDFVPEQDSFLIQMFRISAELFFSKIAFLLVFCAFLFNKKKFDLYFYSFYIIFSMLILCGLISTIKPVIRDWYFVCLIPFSIIIVSKTFFIPFKNKIFKIIFSILLLVSYFSFQDCFDRYKAKKLNIDLISKTVLNDKDKTSAAAIVGYSFFATFYNLQNDIIEIPSQADNDEIYQIIKEDNHKTIYLKIDENAFDYWKNKFKKVENKANNKDEIIIKIFK